MKKEKWKRRKNKKKRLQGRNSSRIHLVAKNSTSIT